MAALFKSNLWEFFCLIYEISQLICDYLKLSKTILNKNKDRNKRPKVFEFRNARVENSSCRLKSPYRICIICAFINLSHLLIAEKSIYCVLINISI